MNLELLILLGVDQCSQDIGRQEVRGELDSAEPGIHRLRQCIDSQSLGQSRHTFEKNVSISQETNEKVLHKLLLADNDLSHLKGKKVHEGAFLLDPLIQFFYIDTVHY